MNNFIQSLLVSNTGTREPNLSEINEVLKNEKEGGIALEVPTIANRIGFTGDMSVFESILRKLAQKNLIAKVRYDRFTFKGNSRYAASFS